MARRKNREVLRGISKGTAESHEQLRPTSAQSLAFALDNVTRYGDTDIFPYPIEKTIFYDKRENALRLLLEIEDDFDGSMLGMPPIHEALLSAVGYTGFRRGTQIDPIWNVYFLGLVISIGADIEKARIPDERNIVFSYRFKLDPADKTLFDRDRGWLPFQKRAIELAQESKQVLVCDISDFYPRVYHHRLENALKKATTKTEVIRRLKELLSKFSKGVSYGLPVGGPAARLLSELLLNRVDRLLVTKQIRFCRFVDDYHIFADTQEQAYEHLVYLCETLLENEGLSLQKNKTRILTSAEFLETSEFSDTNLPESEQEAEARQFLRLHIHYDPYSETADEDYEKILEELNKFDVVGMLAREMQKTRVDQALTRKLIKSIGHIDRVARNGAVKSLLENLSVLFPIFPTVMILLRNMIDELDEPTQAMVFRDLRDLIRTGSYIIRIPVNLAFAIRVLAHDNSDETDEVLIDVYQSTSSMIIKRDVILILAHHNADYWISDRLKHFSSVTLWERRALIIASYILEDEGREWRRRIRDELSPVEDLILEWAAEKKNSGNSWFSL